MNKNFKEILNDNKSFSTNSLDEDGFLEHIRCPICTEIPSAEIYQCKNGHFLCHTCLSSIEKCPQCRESFEDKGNLARVRALESLVEAIKKGSIYRDEDNGNEDEEEVLEKRNKVPFQNCSDQVNCIQLCKKLGYNCDYWTKVINLISTVDHFKNHHSAVIVNGRSVGFDITYFTRRTCETHLDSVWNPVFINTPDGLHFIVLTLFNAVGGTVSWICLDLNEEIAPVESTVEIIIKNKFARSIPLKWTQRAVGLKTLKSVDWVGELVRYEIPAKQLVENHVVYSLKHWTDILPIEIRVLSSTVCMEENRRGQRRIGRVNEQEDPVQLSLSPTENVGIVESVLQKANQQLEQIRRGFFTILEEVFG